MRFLTATHVLLPEGLRADKALAMDANGTVTAVLPVTEAPPDALERFNGTLCPGLVNAHCHLELSHLRGRIPRGTGLPGFVAHVVRERSLADLTDQLESIENALAQAYASGTVLIGDIANTNVTVYEKRDTPVATHTFVEIIGAVPHQAETRLATAYGVLASFEAAKLPATLAPHAPYSLHRSLLEQVYAVMAKQGGPISLHLLETPDERTYLESHTGPFADLFARMQLPPVGPPTAPLSHVAPQAPLPNPVLLVHLLAATAEDWARFPEVFPNPYYVACPRANAYIQSQLPDYTAWPWASGRVCLGTDSLASNDDLTLLAEAHCIHARFGISEEQLLLAATRNGADALQRPDLGRFAPGLRPGVLVVKDWHVQWVVPVTNLPLGIQTRTN